MCDRCGVWEEVCVTDVGCGKRCERDVACGRRVCTCVCERWPGKGEVCAGL